MKEQLIKLAISLGYEKHSGFTSKELDEQPIISIYKQIEYFLIQKWLREKHNLHIYIVPSGDCNTWAIANIGRTDKKDSGERLYYAIRKKYDGERFETYEQALEKGLFEALKLIK